MNLLGLNKATYKWWNFPVNAISLKSLLVSGVDYKTVSMELQISLEVVECYLWLKMLFESKKFIKLDLVAKFCCCVVGI